MWFSTSSGRIELRLTKAQAQTGYHPGQCDGDIAYLRQEPSIKRQLSKLAPDLLVDELREYGAWDADELADHDANLDRILWLACGDIIDNT
jgi:hypothetical protein